MSGKRDVRKGRRDSYRLVYQHFAGLIDAGELLPGDKLPTTPEIEKQHDISHATVTKVMRLLRQDLYVRSSPQGVFVNLARHQRLYQHLCDVLNSLEEMGEQLRTEEFEGHACIGGRNGIARQDPETRRWET